MMFPRDPSIMMFPTDPSMIMFHPVCKPSVEQMRNLQSYMYMPLYSCLSAYLQRSLRLLIYLKDACASLPQYHRRGTSEALGAL
jgi:hypothetical protein